MEVPAPRHGRCLRQEREVVGGEMKPTLNHFEVYRMFLHGFSFRHIAAELEADPMDVARSVGRMCDLEWRHFRGVAG